MTHLLCASVPQAFSVGMRVGEDMRLLAQQQHIEDTDRTLGNLNFLLFYGFVKSEPFELLHFSRLRSLFRSPWVSLKSSLRFYDNVRCVNVKEKKGRLIDEYVTDSRTRGTPS